ncbi:HIT-like domain containing protein [Rhypophila decipiens]
MDDHSTTTSNGSKHNSKTDGGDKPIYFGPFEVTNQVFLTTPHSFALVNLKPLLPGHVLVCPLRRAKRLTDLSAVEITDLFGSVQKVQRMLARYYFSSSAGNNNHHEKGNDEEELCAMGSFNIAVQDGPEAGQTVAHVHVHVIPRIRGSTAKDVETPSDELYDRMAGEDGNVGGAHWDRLHQNQNQNHHETTTIDMDGASRRPEPGGQFPSIEDSQRVARGMEEMEAEAEVFREVLRGMDLDG